MLHTKRQIGVIEVFQEDCHCLHRAALLDPLLKVHTMDQESIFGFKLRNLCIGSVLDVIIHPSLTILAHLHYCRLVDMEWIIKVYTQRVLNYCCSDLFEVFYQGLLCFLYCGDFRIEVEHLHDYGLELLQLGLEHADYPRCCELCVDMVLKKGEPQHADQSSLEHIVRLNHILSTFKGLYF
jgi:hypothetical protein